MLAGDAGAWTLEMETPEPFQTLPGPYSGADPRDLTAESPLAMLRMTAPPPARRTGGQNRMPASTRWAPVRDGRQTTGGSGSQPEERGQLEER